MRSSQFFICTQKEIPNDAEIISHQLMLRSGMIRKISSGLYVWLPLGLRVLKKIETVVRQEMNRIGFLELSVPSIQPAELWQATNRWNAYGKEMLKLEDRHQHQYCYAPTAEDIITEIMQQLLSSYKQLPLTVYQISHKFRDEIRPRFGILRAREFLMKDAYSFHLNQASFDETYEAVFNAYHRIFQLLGLDFRAVTAEGGNIGDGKSHEFQVLAHSGEDEIIYNDSGSYAANIEIAAQSGLKAGELSPDGHGILKNTRGIEVGHIFSLGSKYSDALNATVIDKTGKARALQMGCYGIGVSRIVGAAIEQCHDDKGIIWSDVMAPFQLTIIAIGLNKSSKVRATAEKIYQELIDEGLDVLFDDRDERPGVAFTEADLIGIPHRLVIGERGLNNNTVEYKARHQSSPQEIAITDVTTFILSQLNHLREHPP